MNEQSSSSVFTNDNIEDIVPSEWKYQVTQKLFYGIPQKLEISLKVALFSQEDIAAWIEALEEKTHCNYSIVHTGKVAGQKLVFKRYFHCHHRTRSKQTYPSRWGTKNTNCPSKLIISLLKTGNKKFQEKGKLPPDPKMPCIIDYVVTHNHSPVLSAKFRKVCHNVNKELLNLFSKGHSASTAFETIRSGVQINNPTDYEDLLGTKAVPSEWKYKVINKVVFGSPSKLEVCIKVSLYTIAEIEKWIEALEEKTQCSYSIQMTKKTVGEKVLFKRRYHCRVKTNLNKCYPDLKSGFKNAKKCPSKLSITLMHIKKKKYRGKYPPDPEMPCIVDYVITHNHSLSIAAKFRKVTRNVQETMNRLFRAGHSASTVYEILRIDAQINNPNTYEELLVNRSVCPDRNYCHKWFNEYKKEHGTIDVKDKTFVSKRLQEFNIEVNEECGKIEILDDGFVIVLCPPLFKRVHQYIKSPSEVVFVAAINPADNDGSKAFFLMTHSECGALPLGIIITSSENSELITSGLNTLKVLVGDTMFFGRKEGPQLFLVDDCEAVQMAINTVWPETNILFCSLHILHSLWKYLLCSKNGINKDEPINFFKQFRMIMYADTVDECNQCYSEAMLSAANHPNYLQILEAYWDKRDMWTMSYRNCLLPSDNLKINSLEKMMCLLREPMFHRMRSFNVIQLVDFLLTKFVDFYTLRLLDAANNRLIRDMSRKIPLPPDVKDLEQVNSYLYLVPSIKLPYIRYYVNIEIVACTCLKYTTGYICNHIGWLLTMFLSYQDQIEDHNVREIFQKTATGERFLPEQPYEVFQETEELDPKMKYAEPESKVVEQLIIAGNEVIKLQIVNDEVDPNVSMPMQISNLPYVSGVLVPVVTDEQALEAGENVNQELFGTFSGFLKKSPLLVGPVLQRMLNKTKSLNSVEDFLVACQKFNEDGTPS